MINKLLVSPSPHIHGGDTIERNMYGVIVALLPAFAAALYFFGWGALWVTLTSVMSCMLVEFLIARYLMGSKRLTITDGSAALTGFLLALNLPSNLPLWIVMIGAVVAIGIGKMSFGGLGCNIFNPAILGRVFLLVSFPQQMTSWPITRLAKEEIMAKVGSVEAYTGENPIDALTGATPLGVMKSVINGAPGASLSELPSLQTLLLGNTGGSLGEVSALALLIGLAYLLIRKVITWHIPLSILGTAALFSALMHWAEPAVFAGPIEHLLSGGMLLGAIFMATDYVTSPMSKGGMIIYGIFIGLITMLIRLFGAYPEGMSFAILIMNAFVPLINRYFKPRLFGSTKRIF